MNFFVDISQISKTGIDYVENLLKSNNFLKTYGGTVSGNIDINTTGLSLFVDGNISGGSGVFLDSFNKKIGIGTNNPSGVLHIYNQGDVGIYIDPKYPNEVDSNFKIKKDGTDISIFRGTGGNIDIYASGDLDLSYADIIFKDSSSNKFFQDNKDNIFFNKIILQNNSKIEDIYSTDINYNINIIDSVDLSKNAACYYDLYLYESGQKYIGNFKINIGYSVLNFYDFENRYDTREMIYFYYTGKDISGNTWSQDLNTHPYKISYEIASKFKTSGFNYDGSDINTNFVPHGVENNKQRYYSEKDTGILKIKWDSSKWIFESGGSILFRNESTGKLPIETGWKVGAGDLGVGNTGQIIYISDKIENYESLIYTTLFSGTKNSGQYIVGKKYLLADVEKNTFYPTGEDASQKNYFIAEIDKSIGSLYTGNFTIFLKTPIGIGNTGAIEVFIKNPQYGILNDTNKATDWHLEYSNTVNSMLFSFKNYNATGYSKITGIDNIIQRNNESGIDGSVYIMKVNYNDVGNPIIFQAKYYSDNLNSSGNYYTTGIYTNDFYDDINTPNVELYHFNDSVYEYGLINRIISDQETENIFQTSRLQDSVKSGIKFLFKFKTGSLNIIDQVSNYTGFILSNGAFI